MTGDAEDFALLTRWRDGDHAAGDELTKRHYDTLRRFVAARVHGFHGDEAAKAELSRDITQQAFVKLCEKKHDFRGHSKFRTFVLGIGHFTLLEFQKKRRKDEHRFEPLTETQPDGKLDVGISTLFAQRQELRRLADALAELPIEDQAVLRLHYFEGLSHREIGQQLDATKNQVNGRVARAKAKLRAVFERDHGPTTEGELDDVLRDVLEVLGREAGRPIVDNRAG